MRWGGGKSSFTSTKERGDGKGFSHAEVGDGTKSFEVGGT